MRTRTEVPTYAPDIYSTAGILDPYPHYRTMRDLGPIVWLAKQNVYALPRYAESKAVLRDDAGFVSEASVALNGLSNRLSRGTTLASDGAEHSQRRKLLAHRMLPRALQAMSANVDATADAVVEAALARGTVDGVADLASALPLAVVPDLIGWPDERRDRLVEWGGATFDILGPLNWQAAKSIPHALQMLRFARHIVRTRSVLPGSLADELLTAADEGRLRYDECPALMVDYLAPSIDTTMSAISTALYLFATHPEQWATLREDPSLIPNAINEVLRYEPPLRAFGRRAVRPTELSGAELPAGAHVLVMYASANRDEREWDNPDVFDIRRDAGRQIGFGIGAHSCAGQALARLETAAMLRALAERVQLLELTGKPVWAINNIIRRHERLPLKLLSA